MSKPTKPNTQTRGATCLCGGTRLAALITALVCLSLSGCNRTPGPPPPLPAEQIPAELQKAFAKANASTKELVNEIERALQSKDYPAAYQRVEVLCSLPEANPDQRLLSTRAMLSLTTLLQSAQAQGDPSAAAVLQQHQRNR